MEIAASDLFDAQFYLNANPDVAASLMDPILHYVRYGEHESRDPSPAFSIELYRPLYRDKINILYQHILKLKSLS